MDLAAVGRYWAQWQPEATAIRFEGRDVSWRTLDQRTDALAAGLAGLGLEPGDRLGILGNNSVSWCEAVLAAAKLGAAAVPLNVRLAPAELAYIVGNAGCRAVVVDADLADRYDEAAPSLSSDILRIRMEGAPGDGPSLDDLASSGASFPAVDHDENAPAVIAYTSGTTGRPKGAVLTHRNLLAHVTLKGLCDGWSPATRTLLCVPLAFTGGIVNNFLATYGVGGTLVLERTFDPASALALMTTQRISVMIGVPVMWQGIAAVPGFAEADLSALTTAITGGAPVPEPLLRTYQAKGVMIRQAYGLTEGTALVCQLPPGLAVAKPKASGLPSLHTKIQIVDDAGAPVAAGEAGEILVQGPQVMAGYWGDEAATAAALQGGWLHTGDIGRLDEDGLLEIVDRKNDLIISGGLNVYPAEIERALAEHPAMIEAAVVGVADERWGEVPLAVVRCSAPVEAADITAFCRERLADYKTPRHVVVVDEPLPRSMSGKVLRRELREQYRHQGDPVPVKFGTVDFFQAMADQLNNDPKWAELGSKLSYSMVYVYGPPVDNRFFVVFAEGKVTEVREGAAEDEAGADFVISGAAEVWRGVFEKTVNPTAALTTGKLKVKGKMTALLKNMSAFSYVIEAMTKVDFE